MASKKKINYAKTIELLEAEHKLKFKKEFKFHPVRRWRIDFALPCCKLGLEIEGGSWSGGGHTRGSGFARDMLKYNSASILGWRILRFTPQEIQNLKFLTTVRQYLYNHPCLHNSESIAHFELKP